MSSFLRNETFSRNNPKIADILSRLQKLHPENIDLGLGRTFKLLEKLDNPQNHLPPVIHIAGTNGKGSTLSFIQAILESAGLTVHRYTSPELVKFNERYIISGKEISDADLLKYLELVEKINDGDAITFFEITTAICFKMFADNKADVVLLETGMGGRLDSTNVVPNTVVNIISNISLDHQVFLGDSLEKIATEKSGIIRPQASVVISPQDEVNVDATIIGRANEVGGIVNAHKLNWEYELLDNGFVLHTKKGSYKLPIPNLIGLHQYDNASSAIVACQELSRVGIKIDKLHFEIGLKNTIHRGRFEKINIPDINKDIYLDGGHNPSAGLKISENLKALGNGKASLICGMLSGKDIHNFIKPLKPYIENVYTITVKDNPFSTTPAINAIELSQEISSLGLKSNPCNSLQQALTSADNDDTNIILCAGSLHLVGDALDLL